MLSDENLLSQTILFLRFPLIVGVVFVHNNLSDVIIRGISLVEDGQFPLYEIIFHILSDELARIAVPLFFFISGFLFFYRTDFSSAVYVVKLKKRVRTLLVPYLFWNIVVFVCSFLTQSFLASMTSGRAKLISEYGIVDWLNLFWNYRKGYPICYQFWFIRDLMIVILFSPLLYLWVKKTRTVGIVLLGLLWILSIWSSVNVPGINITAFFFFSFGAYYGINGRNFVTDFGKVRLFVTCLYPILVAVSTIVWHQKIAVGNFLHQLGILIGLVTIVSWVSFGIEKNRLYGSTFLAGSSFFVYAYHGMCLAFIMRYWLKLFQPLNEMTVLGGYFLISFFVSGFGVGLYALLKKCFPTFTGIITGGR